MSLRLLRSSTDIEDYAAEVVPEKGNLLGFRRCDRSFHGHKPYAGPRRAIQLSWLDPKPETKGGRRWRKLTRRLRRIFSS